MGVFGKMRPLPWIILLIGITLVQGERSSLDEKETVSKLPEKESGKAEEIEKIIEKKQKYLKPQRSKPSVVSDKHQLNGKNSEIDNIREKQQKPLKPQRPKSNKPSVINDNDQRKGSNSEIESIRGKKPKPSKRRRSKPNSSRNKNVPRKPPSSGDPRKRELQNRSKQERKLLMKCSENSKSINCQKPI